ncbi:MAG: glycosyltransferase [Pseudomonadota bacterium]
MRICFINPHSDPLAKPGEPDSGGQCIVESHLMKYFVKISPDVTIDSFTRLWGDKPEVEQIADRARVIRVLCNGQDFIPKEMLWETLPEFVDKMLIRWADEKRQYDIYHAHYADGGKAALITMSKKSAPLVFTAHSLGKLKQMVLPDEKAYRYSVRIPAEQETLAKASRIIALNKVEIGHYKELYGITPPKVRVIPNGVDTEYYKPAPDRDEIRKKLGWEGKRVVFTIGRIDARKGFNLLASAAADVMHQLKEAGKEVLFLLPGAGKGRTKAERVVVDEMAELLGEAVSSTAFFPRLSDEELLEYYRAADLFVCPSPYEPFGLVVIEAMACGVPVVSFNSGGPADIISHGVDGELADIVEGPKSLAKAMVKVLIDEDRRLKMGKMGRKKVEAHYSWDAVARSTLELYQEVIDARS